MIGMGACRPSTRMVAGMQPSTWQTRHVVSSMAKTFGGVI
jgi:hypothetical protein